MVIENSKGGKKVDGVVSDAIPQNELLKIKIAEPLLKNIGYNNEEIAEIQFLIKNHDEFIPISKIEDATSQRVAKLLKNIARKNPNYTPTITDYKG